MEENRTVAAPSTESARSYYQRREGECRARETRAARRVRRCARWRLLLFLVGVSALVAALSTPHLFHAGMAVVVVSTVAFVVAAGVQERAERDRVRAERLRTWYRRSLARLERDWKELPPSRYTPPENDAWWADDLDLFGSGSLFQLVENTQTPLGRERLARWLLEPAEPPEIKHRQAALDALAADRRLREAMFERGAELAASLADPKHFLNWATSPTWYARRRWLKWIAPASVIGLLSTTLVAVLIGPDAWIVAAGFLLVSNVFCLLGWGASLVATFDRVQSRFQEVSQYRTLFDMLDAAVERHPALGHWLTHHVGESFRQSDGPWKELQRIMALNTLRYAGLLSIAHTLLQPLLLWDFHVMRWLDRWKTKYGRFVPLWFEELASLEALASLAVLRHDHPDWAFPCLDAATDRWQGEGVGHPLIADGQRVGNDVTVGPPGTVLLVTGSNMSGKSTLLRAIGVNTVLAQAGAPVCAKALTLPPVRIATSMRVRDSIEEGTSFYLAELKRLKRVVSMAKRATDERRLLYLLDEILQGTNSRERHIAVAHVLATLTRYPAIGAISTHDVELASSPLVADAVRAVHFRESFREGPNGREMVFDYRLREGVATTTNAWVLLEMVGLAD